MEAGRGGIKGSSLEAFLVCQGWRGGHGLGWGWVKGAKLHAREYPTPLMEIVG